MRFTAAAADVRAAGGRAAPHPLDGRAVVVACPPRAVGRGNAGGSAGAGGGLGGAAGGAAAHRAAMQRLVRALGGRVVGPRAADLCVVCAGGGPTAVPRELAARAAVVTEEWLLAAAEAQRAPPEARYALKRG